MQYEYKNVVVRLGSELEARMDRVVERESADSWDFFGSHALPDSGGVVMQFRRQKYRGQAT